MFRCQLCQCVVPPQTPCQHLVLKRRSKAYPYRSRANTFISTNEAGKRKEYHTDDPGGTGEEVVREVTTSPACATRTCRPRIQTSTLSGIAGLCQTSRTTCLT